MNLPHAKSLGDLDSRIQAPRNIETSGTIGLRHISNYPLTTCEVAFLLLPPILLLHFPMVQDAPPHTLFIHAFSSSWWFQILSLWTSLPYSDWYYTNEILCTQEIVCVPVSKITSQILYLFSSQIHSALDLLGTHYRKILWIDAKFSVIILEIPL